MTTPVPRANKSPAAPNTTTGSALAALWMASFGLAAAELPVGSRVLYETGFERFEGFSAENDLAGQSSWIGYATDLAGNSVALGGNGLLPGPTDGFYGQTAYIGFNAPAATADFNVWHPINLAPVGDVLPVVQFTVAFQIEASSDGQIPDAFRWSFYNAAEQRLFSLDFDNATREISAILDDGTATQAPPVRPSGFLFRNAEPFDLEVQLNFQRNLWTAKLNGSVIVNALAITTKNSARTLGDVDAVWLIREPGNPGDNFMLFDDYRLVATPLEEIPPTLEVIGLIQPSGAFVIRVLGEPGVKYQLEASTDGASWFPVGHGRAQSPDAYVDIQDASAKDAAARIYRAISVP
jgi:hypothetical protein